MGDPRRLKKKYQTPMHPWQKSRLEEEKPIKKTYGLKNKKELWKMGTILRNFANQAKRLIAATGNQAEVERQQLFARLEKLGLLSKGSAFDAVLGLDVNHILDRRLQTIVFKRGLSHSVKQARQFITHNHILVSGKLVTSPSYLVSVSEEGQIGFVARSPMANESHPERAPPEQKKGTIMDPNLDAEDNVKKLEEEAAKKGRSSEVKKEAPKKAVKEVTKEVAKEESKKEVSSKETTQKKEPITGESA